MKIAIDARAWQWTGIGRYIRSLLKEYAVRKTGHTFIILTPNNEEEALREAIRTSDDNFIFHPVEPSYYSIREQTRFPSELSRLDADLFHFTHFNVPIRFSRPYVVSIHDTTRFIFPGQKRQRLLEQVAYEYVFSRAVAKARAVIAVTEHTRQELLRLPLNIPGAVQVIHEGVDEHFRDAVDELNRQKIRSLIETNDPYLLYVGVWMSHKNLERLLLAFRLVREHHPDLKLVITGKPVPKYSNVLQKTEELGLRNSIIFPGFVSHQLLPALYAEASCFVFPSLYEGFGLPALEAAASGTPVVASNVSSLPEIMGKAAEYVNPEHVPDIARGIRRVLEDEIHRRELSVAGRQQAAGYSWKECARQTLDVYENGL